MCALGRQALAILHTKNDAESLQRRSHQEVHNWVWETAMHSKGSVPTFGGGPDGEPGGAPRKRPLPRFFAQLLEQGAKDRARSTGPADVLVERVRVQRAHRQPVPRPVPRPVPQPSALTTADDPDTPDTLVPCDEEADSAAGGRDRGYLTIGIKDAFGAAEPTCTLAPRKSGFARPMIAWARPQPFCTCDRGCCPVGKARGFQVRGVSAARATRCPIGPCM